MLGQIVIAAKFVKVRNGRWDVRLKQLSLPIATLYIGYSSQKIADIDGFSVCINYNVGSRYRRTMSEPCEGLSIKYLQTGSSAQAILKNCVTNTRNSQLYYVGCVSFSKKSDAVKFWDILPKAISEANKAILLREEFLKPEDINMPIPIHKDTFLDGYTLMY